MLIEPCCDLWKVHDEPVNIYTVITKYHVTAFRKVKSSSFRTIDRFEYR